MPGRYAQAHLPKGAGLSLKPQHFEHIIQHQPNIAFFEVHPENYMTEGGQHLSYLEQICEHYPLSMHGVGLSLGSSDGVKQTHLARLAQLVERFQPTQVSEHISWSHWNEVFINDLLPLPYTKESLALVRDNIERVQETLKRTILIENPSIYIDFSHHDYSETAFLNTLCQQTGCGLLLDINNIVVSAFNNNFDARHYLDAIAFDNIGEIHLAGHTSKTLIDDKRIKIDDHGSAVPDDVWALYSRLLSQSHATFPTLIEWDTDVPDFSTLEQEAKKAVSIISTHNAQAQTVNEAQQC